MFETIRSVLALPQAYQLFFNVIGAPERSRILVREYIRPKPGDRILEIGCGPGTIVPYLPATEYVGFDASPEYIALAQKRFPRAKFVCERVSQYTLPHREYFDIVLALGIVAVVVVVDATRYDENNVGEVGGVGGRPSAGGRRDVPVTVIEARAEGHWGTLAGF